MSDRNWGMIRDGLTFEALMSALVSFEDSAAISFGRPGKDAGQDARSGDGKCVFQAKFHADEQAWHAIQDAKDEAEKIIKYRRPGDESFQLWKDVGEWCLVSNVAFNPMDEKRWTEEVVPLYSDLGLRATYWLKPKLNDLLAKHPEVDQDFFNGETRVFLTIAEACSTLRLGQLSSTPVHGRSEEIKKVYDFLSDGTKVFFVINGEGGIGKTRLMLEVGAEIAAKGNWRVYWANVESMSASSAWYRSILLERKTLLLIDEPTDGSLLKRIVEQIGGGRMKEWKVIVAVRSSKDPVLGYLQRPDVCRFTVDLSLKPLSISDARNMCEELLAVGGLKDLPQERREKVAKDLAEMSEFAQRPIWLVLAVKHLEKFQNLNDLPHSTKAVAKAYLDEVYGDHQGSKEKRRELMRWLALFGASSLEVEWVLDWLKEKADLTSRDKVKEMLLELVKHGGLIRRGAYNRLVEIKPDVLRDYVLLEWLAPEDEGRFSPSHQTKGFVGEILMAMQAGKMGFVEKKMLVSLARADMLLRMGGHDVHLLDELFQKLYESVPRMTGSAKLTVIRNFIEIARVYPKEAVKLSKILRKPPQEAKPQKDDNTTKQDAVDAVTMELAWLVFLALDGAHEEIDFVYGIEELCDILEAEEGVFARKSWLRTNDGKRGDQLVGRALEGEKQFLPEFNSAVRKVVESYLGCLKSTQATDGVRKVLKSLIDASTSVERRSVENRGRSFTVGTYTIRSNSEPWKTRMAIVDRIKEMLASEGLSTDAQIFLWGAFSEAHRNARHGLGDGESGEEMKRELLKDFAWAKVVLPKVNDIEILQAARDLWGWYISYGDDQEFQRLAAELEAIYKQNNLVEDLAPLLDFDDWVGGLDAKKPLIEERVKKLAESGDYNTIRGFFEDAVKFSHDGRSNYVIRRLAHELGMFASQNEFVAQFIRDALKSVENSSVLGELALLFALGWIQGLRGSDPDLVLIRIKELSALLPTSKQSAFLVQLYGSSDMRGSVEGEVEYIFSVASLFILEEKFEAYIQIVGWTLRKDWEGFKAVVERVLSGAPIGQITKTVVELIGVVHQSLEGGVPDNVMSDVSGYIFLQILRVPDMDDLESHSWEIGELLKKAGQLPLSLLPSALRARKKLEDSGHASGFHGLGFRSPLAMFFKPITTEGDAEDPSIASALREAIDFVTDEGMFGYLLPKVLWTVDPSGLFVSKEIARRFVDVTDEHEQFRLARVAAAYGIGSNAWRTIAKPVIATAVDSADPRSLFGALSDLGIRSWSSAPGEVPKVFISNVDDAERSVREEVDSDFRPFWERRLKVAKAEFRQREEEAKEDAEDDE